MKEKKRINEKKMREEGGTRVREEGGRKREGEERDLEDVDLAEAE